MLGDFLWCKLYWITTYQTFTDQIELFFRLVDRNFVGLSLLCRDFHRIFRCTGCLLHFINHFDCISQFDHCHEPLNFGNPIDYTNQWYVLFTVRNLHKNMSQKINKFQMWMYFSYCQNIKIHKILRHGHCFFQNLVNIFLVKVKNEIHKNILCNLHSVIFCRLSWTAFIIWRILFAFREFLARFSANLNKHKKN